MSNVNTATAQDAIDRIREARLGCVRGGPTEEYVRELRRQVASWLAAIDEYIAEHEVKR